MDEETKLMFEKIEKRLEALEGKKEVIKEETENNFKGLNGGINFIIQNGFLKSLKSLDEIWNELKREGYVYPKTSVAKTLNVDLVNKKKIMVRIEEQKIWKYAIRK